MNKVIVTGGAGFIGSHTARGLLDAGYEVHIIDDLSDGKRERVPEKATLHVADIREACITDILRGAQAVFHLAALPRVPYSVEYPKESNEVNVTGTLAVLVAARDAGVKKVIFSSSSAVYGTQEIVPLVETMPVYPDNPYGLHKSVSEQYMRLFTELYGMQTVCLRYFNVYGPGMDPHGGYALAIPRFLLLHAKGEPLTITGDGAQTRDFIHVHDVVRAQIRAYECDAVGKGEVINIGSGRSISMNELAALIGGECTYVPARPEARHMLADITRAKEVLGWEPLFNLEEGIEALRKEYTP